VNISQSLVNEIINYRIACLNCRKPYPDTGTPYRCACGGLFDYQDPILFDPQWINPENTGIWRYKQFFGLPPASPIISLGEGNTPLVWINYRGVDGSEQAIGLKCEYQNPTGSFKDRGSPLILSFLVSRGTRKVAEDSSGNAGASFAAYAARVGLEAKVYVPESASEAKRRQIESYGAKLIQVPGSRSKAAELIRKDMDSVSPKDNWAYASHAYLPFNLPGYATLAFELAEQCKGDIGTILVPVGQGGLVLGLARGFKSLLRQGSIKRFPYIVGVQAQACAPLWALTQYGASGLKWTGEGKTIAEGIAIRYPLRGDQIISVIENEHGKFVVVSEDEILAAHTELAARGFLVEYTSAVVWAALAKIPTPYQTPIIAILTGSGLKSL
jgi:threonine synthase